eukprot:CAMPEP_0185192686 /NCGR_PEP_ID=MMETSP1140-20130426/19878_1 /TAXON_ID=298111 /ORGANISM="Pavlova sp., Strain CCMP459" /LENGTH=108 /DNA_ID=CAMNT_0027759445 /DNA_START=26 /DNA_END=353 /DNA_ORIENTATION=+
MSSIDDTRSLIVPGACRCHRCACALRAVESGTTATAGQRTVAADRDEGRSGYSGKGARSPTAPAAGSSAMASGTAVTKLASVATRQRVRARAQTAFAPWTNKKGSDLR